MMMADQEMTVVEISRPGGPDVLRLVRRPRPKPERGEILVAVAAAGINRPDVSQRKGATTPPPGASDIPGLEIAGTVAAVGDDVAEWRVGDRVMALVKSGGYATYCVAPAAQCLPVPPQFTFIEAAAVPKTFFTVWANVFELGRLAPGETLLVHGGASGIGTTAIQLAKALGSRVIVTAGSDERCRSCRDLGADLAVNYRTQDFVEAAKAFTDDQGVNLILDIIGGDYFGRNLDLLAFKGRLVHIALMQGPHVSASLLPILAKQLTITGSTLRPRSVEEKGAIAGALRKRVWPLLESGAIRPVVERTYPIAEVATAHHHLEGDHIGKIVLTMTGGEAH